MEYGDTMRHHVPIKHGMTKQAIIDFLREPQGMETVYGEGEF